MTDAAHQSLIRDQFTRQTPFSTAAPIASEAAWHDHRRRPPGRDDTVFDVACGGGIVVAPSRRIWRHRHRCERAGAGPRASPPRARRVPGGSEVDRLPYPDGAFTIVVTRFTMHHFLDPAAVFREMVRVCAPGGRVVVVDTYTSEDPAKAAAFNRLEILRDPSHARSLYLAELKGLFQTAGLGEPRTSFYELRDTVTNLLARSFPNPGDDRDHRDVHPR
jgi:SAM-dependent methyltransferase